jgi:membrane protein DedA with SNARE-associated domain
VLLAAGATQYPRRKFVGALSAGRGVRYLIVAGMGAMFGDSIVSFFSRYYMPALFTLIGLAVIGTIITIVEYKRSQHRRKEKQSHQSASQQRVA